MAAAPAPAPAPAAAAAEEKKAVEVGLIILGNSGVGKSLLANTILGENNKFKHEYACEAVTLLTESASREVGEFKFAIYNIPGLIENDQKRIEKNKEEIEKAFKAHPLSVICYVFGNQNGRIKNEDVVAFKAIDAAYTLNRKSLVFVVNNVRVHRSELYEGQTTVCLSRLLNIPADEIKVTFVDEMQPAELAAPPDSPVKLRVRATLLALLLRAHASVHTRQDSIKLEKDVIKELEAAEEKKHQEFLALVNEKNEEIVKLTTAAQQAAKQQEKEIQDLKNKLAQPQTIIEKHFIHEKSTCDIM